jgi:ketosteroid isomerase-like protein
MRTTVESYYRFVDANNLDGLVALFTSDCTYHRPGYPPIVGQPALRAFYTDTRIISAGRHVLVRVLQDEDAAAVEGTFEGQLKNGEQVSVRFSDFFTMRGGLIAARRTYFFAPRV